MRIAIFAYSELFHLAHIHPHRTSDAIQHASTQRDEGSLLSSSAHDFLVAFRVVTAIFDNPMERRSRYRTWNRWQGLVSPTSFAGPPTDARHHPRVQGPRSHASRHHKKQRTRVQHPQRTRSRASTIDPNWRTSSLQPSTRTPDVKSRLNSSSCLMPKSHVISRSAFPVDCPKVSALDSTRSPSSAR